MKKVFLGIFVLLFLLSSCRVQTEYDFLLPNDEIVEISVVTLHHEDGEVIETEVKKVEDTAAFLEEFKKIGCYVYFGDPTGVTPDETDGTVIKILYQNGEYELINYCGQARYLEERGLVYYAGYYAFDREAFEALIKTYSE